MKDFKHANLKIVAKMKHQTARIWLLICGVLILLSCDNEESATSVYSSEGDPNLLSRRLNSRVELPSGLDWYERRQVKKGGSEKSEIIDTLSSEHFSALSSCYGKIQEVLVVLPSGDLDEGGVLNGSIFSSLFANSTLNDPKTNMSWLVFIDYQPVDVEEQKELFVAAKEKADSLKSEAALYWSGPEYSIKPIEVEHPFVVMLGHKVVSVETNTVLQKVRIVIAKPNYCKVFQQTITSASDDCCCKLCLKKLCRTSHSLSGFPEDPFWVMRHKYAKASFVVETIFPGYTNVDNLADMFLPEYLASIDRDYTVLPAPFPLEGGNILVGSDFAIVGMTTRLKYESAAASSRVVLNQPPSRLANEAKLMVRKVLNLSAVHWVDSGIEFDGTRIPDFFRGNNPRVNNTQPFYHTDMFMTLIGKTSRDSLAPELLLVAEVVPEFIHVEDVDPLKVDTAVTTLNLMLGNIARSFSVIKRGERPKFEVHRLPLPIVFKNVTTGGTLNADVFSHNNCLVENFQSAGQVVCRAYVPSFVNGFDNHLPNEVRKILLKSHGYVDSILKKNNVQSEPVSANFARAARRLASLNCVVKVLRRGEYPDVASKE